MMVQRAMLADMGLARKFYQRDIDAALPQLVAWAETKAYRKD